MHAGTGVLAEPPAPAAAPAGVSAETPAAPARVPGDPADPARCHVEDGPAISVSTAQMIACTAALSWMTHGDGGAVLALGRRRRRPSSAIRRAARERDHGRCRFPGCESRRVDLHHIQHWVNGGRTDLDNLISLCPCHHKVVHDRGYLIAAPPGGAFTFYRPDGTPLPACPPLPEPDGASRTPTTRTSPRTRSSRPGTASGSTWTTPSGSASPTPAPRSRNEPTGSRPRSRCSGRTHGAATSATRSTTSAATTTNTRPPDSPADSTLALAIIPTIEEGTMNRYVTRLDTGWMRRALPSRSRGWLRRPGGLCRGSDWPVAEVPPVRRAVTMNGRWTGQLIAPIPGRTAGTARIPPTRSPTAV